MNFGNIPTDSSARYTLAEKTGLQYERTLDPPHGQPVYILCRDDRGEYECPFAVIFTESDVLNPLTMEVLADDFAIVGWRIR